MNASVNVKSFRLAAVMLLLASPVYAQAAGGDEKTPAQLEREKAAEREYKDSLKKIPDAKANNDPWSGVRPAEPPPKAPAKPASAKPAPAKSAKAAKGNAMKPSVFDQ